MRLWHQALIPRLPKNQLLGQHRECCALRGAGWGRKHSTVNYVFTHSPQWLFAYHQVVMHEMILRGYKVSDKWLIAYYRGEKESWWNVDEFTKCGSYKKAPSIIYPEHNEAYLLECLANLSAKGINIDISQIKGAETNEIIKVAYRLMQEAHAENRERTNELRKLLLKRRKSQTRHNVRVIKISSESLSDMLKPVESFFSNIAATWKYYEQSPPDDGVEIKEKTILEAVIEKHQHITKNELLNLNCPNSFGYKNHISCRKIKNCCEICWNLPAEGNKLEVKP